MLPDVALAKVLTHRDAVPGYSKDMIRSFAFRTQVGMNAVANLATAAKVSRAFTNMRSAVLQAKSDPSWTLPDIVTAQDIFGEIAQREASRPMRTGRDIFDTLRAINHSYFLGLSPSYALVNLTQVGALLLPELGKRHSFVKAAKAIGKATTPAFKIMVATAAVGKSQGWKRMADAIITEESLTKAGIDEKTANFIMTMVNRGIIDIGSAARELGRVAEGAASSPTDTTLRFGAAFGYYTETLTRLIAALSARELHGDRPGVLDYASATVNEAMFNYASWNTARATSKSGLAGRLSPMIASFMTYQMQLIEKLWRETMTAFVDAAQTPEQKRQARRFLGFHLGAVTVLAGTLGMPMASVLARAAEKLKDLWDDEDPAWDAESAWRNFLAETFGKDVGEVLSRGIFRAVGIDVASRIGEQDILPFTQLLIDRRKFQDSVKDWALQALGAPFSMLASVVEGGTQIAAGDVMQGMQTMMPVAIKGPIKAYRMSTEGYVDTSGNRMPMSVEANDILAQAMGLTPSERAEYSEARLTQTGRRATITQEASRLRRQLAVAVERRDTAAVQELWPKVQRFDRQYPAYAVMSGFEATLRRRARVREMAKQSRTPLGTNIRDTQGVRSTAFANY
jgi:hypothetical protein